ncbi:hypothetical protein [Pseudomonas zhanjiangensis]|uniref:Uncharacterized protein n=1 Tax=Pseudomonas zhanjiangensis TaxID=3239015 RepID=A0ABV3YR54_9PSED
MSEAGDRAASRPPPTLGEGCVRRYDLQALAPGSGCDFAGAAQLWQALQQGVGDKAEQRPQE